jgi:dTMP kinase
VAGLFITFEGVEGCGKTTQMEILANRMVRLHRPVATVREPGGTVIGDALRQLLLAPERREMTPRTEALLYAASRAQLTAEVIKPALAADKIVLCDRYLDSSLAYQAYGRGLDFQAVVSVNEWAMEGLMPDLTLLLRMPAELGLGRAIGEKADRLEQESLHFHQMVEAGYEDLAVKYAERFVLIDGREPVPEVHRRIAAAVDKLLAQRDSG